ncbi:MAG TPA: DUF3237 domain-containing protein [Xanthobacteraceae bacterium]|nr:DUF3237 domain-containing protein [Xanthobacteraceae bacterium]
MAETGSAPTLELIFAANVLVGPPLNFGDVGKGGRRVVPITGGEFSGPNVRGRVLAGGADWQVLRSDGVAELEAHYSLQTDDGALIEVKNLGLRHGPPEIIAALAAGQPVDPASYYFRGAAFFTTGAPRYAWMTRHVTVASGERQPDAVKLKFYRVL